VAIGHYISGQQRPICVKNMEANLILRKLEMLRDSNGEKNRRFKKAVRSLNPSVRGIWSPFHGNGMTI
jgi:large subunit ribosomal protein L43